MAAVVISEGEDNLLRTIVNGRNRSIVYSSQELRYVEAGSIQHDPEMAPIERNRAH